MILDGRAIYGGGLLDGEYGVRLAANAKTRGLVVPPLNRIAEEAPPLYARVQPSDFGAGMVTHWVVDCDCGCKSASVVWLDTPLFLSVPCWNRAWRKRWRRVTLPDEATCAEIDRLLSLRPARNRFWVPGESLDDLRVQNAAHGLEA